MTSIKNELYFAIWNMLTVTASWLSRHIQMLSYTSSSAGTLFSNLDWIQSHPFEVKVTHHMMTSSNGNIFHVTGPFVSGIHRSPVESSNKGQWHGALVFSLICAWTNGWTNNRDAGDLRRRCAHYDVNVMKLQTQTHMWGIGVFFNYRFTDVSVSDVKKKPQLITINKFSGCGSVYAYGDNLGYIGIHVGSVS